jgi:hypothetical protein
MAPVVELELEVGRDVARPAVRVLEDAAVQGKLERTVVRTSGDGPDAGGDAGGGTGRRRWTERWGALGPKRRCSECHWAGPRPFR